MRGFFQKIAASFRSYSQKCGDAWHNAVTPQKKIPVAIIRDEMTYAVREGCYSQIIQTWTTGSFLTAYALVLGANNLIIGLLAAVPFLANVAQTPVTFMIEKYRKRKILTLFFGACNFPLLLLMASFVFFKPSEATAWGLFLCVFPVSYTHLRAHET